MYKYNVKLSIQPNCLVQDTTIQIVLNTAGCAVHDSQ